MDYARASFHRLGGWGFVARTVLVFVPVLLLCIVRLDPDFGWHLQAGNYIREHGIPSHDVFSYTAADFRWINHEWGSDVLLSLIYGLGGYLLAAIMAALLWTMAIVLAAGRIAAGQYCCWRRLPSARWYWSGRRS